MNTSTTIEPLAMIKAHRYADGAGCPRCGSGIFIERCYHEAETIHQFRCITCGWRDDVRHMDTLMTREIERQEQRAATQDAGSWSGRESA